MIRRLARQLPGVELQRFKATRKTETKGLIHPDRVVISMHQQEGEDCVPVVYVGDRVKIGQVIARQGDADGTPVHASISGKVVNMPQQKSWDGAFHLCLEIESDGEQSFYEGIRVPEIDSTQDFFDALRASGLVELSKKPEVAHSKFKADNPHIIDTLIISSAETGPYLTGNYRCMLEAAREIVSGARLLMKYLGISHTCIAVVKNETKAIEALEKHIESDEETEGTISIELLETTYPQGLPRVLICNLTGLKLQEEDDPADLGIMLTNVSTVAFIGQYFKTGIPLVSRRITVTGPAVNDPQNIMVPIGTSVLDAVEACGGYRKEPRKIVMGGAMRGRALPSDRTPITKHTEGIVAFGEDDIIRKREGSCINCGACRQHCPMELDPCRIRKAFDGGNIDVILSLGIGGCVSCGTCSYVCPARRHLTESMNMAKDVASSYIPAEGAEE